MTQANKNYSVAPTIEDKDVYKIVLDTRNLEISLFWQRSNYFLVLNSALALGFFNQAEKVYACWLAFFGIIISALWYRVNLGSKYWQSRWERRLNLIEAKIAPNLQFFTDDWTVISKDVEESLANSLNKGRFHKFIDRQVLKKPSVSYNMTLLSVTFMFGWLVLFVIKFGN